MSSEDEWTEAPRKLVIWWLEEHACRAIGPDGACLPVGLPTYVHDEYRSRYGRAGRGRLWVPEHFGDVKIDPWPETPLATYLARHCGGIVMEDWCAYYVRNLPGIVTDLELRRSQWP